MSGEAAFQTTSKSDIGPPPPGTLLGGRFRLGDMLGAGGMGTVHVAIDENIGRKVAVKVLRGMDTKAALRFEREARAASQMSSRHVVAVHDFGRDETYGLYMVMELLQGQSLGDRLAIDQRIEPMEAGQIALQIAEALQAAHEAGVVHRDLKPDNVFLLEEGGLKVVDFGIARVLHDPVKHKRDVTVTDTDTIVGTPAYLSPEMVSRRDVGPPSDLYQLGVILFQMLAGRLPFIDDEPVAMAAMHLRVPAPAVDSVAPDVEIPPELIKLTAHLLQKEPSARPFGAEQVVLMLRSLSFSESSTIRHAVSGKRVRPSAQGTMVLPSRDRRPLFIGLGVGAVALLALIVTLAWPSDAPGPVTTPLPPLDTDLAPTEPEATAEQGDPVPEAPAPPAAEVEIDVVVQPANATIYWDGDEQVPPLVVDADGEMHTLTVRAPRHRAFETDVRADRDQRINVVLERIRRRGRMDRQLPGKLREW